MLTRSANKAMCLSRCRGNGQGLPFLTWRLSRIAIISLLLANVTLGQPNPPRVPRQAGLRDPLAITELSNTVHLPEIDSETKHYFDQLDQLVTSRQWKEALEIATRLTEYQGHGLVSQPDSRAGYERFVSVPTAVQARLAKFHRSDREMLSRYRELVDSLASKQFALAGQQRDEVLLKRLVRESLLSSVGPDATMLLGDLLLEQGLYDTARRIWLLGSPQLNWIEQGSRLPYWRRLEQAEPIADISRDLLGEPSSDQSRNAEVWSRLTLASILAGESTRASWELKLLQHNWPEARGRLGGTQRNYQQFLAKLLAASSEWPPPKGPRDWLTFAAQSHRNHRARNAIEIPVQPAWQVPLAAATPAHPQIARDHNVPIEGAGENANAPCSHFPIVADDIVIVHDAQGIRCLNLLDGTPAWAEGTLDHIYQPESNAEPSPFGLPTFSSQDGSHLGERRFTLSSNGTLLLATVASKRASKPGRSVLVGFDLEREGALAFDPLELNDERWTFHGAPVCDQDRCWVGARRQDISAQDHVICVDLRTGKEVWRRQIATADTLGHQRVTEMVSHLLTLHEGSLYYHSHLGCVARLDADDGTVEWITRYPRSTPRRANLVREPWHARRDLTPPVHYDGLLMVAPSDADRLFAVSAANGKLVWETPLAPDTTQMLGVTSGGDLVLSGRRLWWLDVYTGQANSRVLPNPFPAGEFATIAGVGRGVLAGGKVYWPTRNDEISKIFVFDEATGRPARQPIELEVRQTSAGNLVLTSTHLLIAAPDRLTAFRRAD